MSKIKESQTRNLFEIFKLTFSPSIPYVYIFYFLTVLNSLLNQGTIFFITTINIHIYTSLEQNINSMSILSTYLSVCLSYLWLHLPLRPGLFPDLYFKFLLVAKRRKGVFVRLIGTLSYSSLNIKSLFLLPWSQFFSS